MNTEFALYVIIGAIVVLLVMSAFFSGSETALTASSRGRIHELARRGNHRAATVRELYHSRERVIGAILIGNNLVNILASALATSLMISLFGDAGVAYATLGMTVIVVIFAEIMPKTYAIQHADKTALGIAPLLRVVVAVLSPPARAVQGLVRLAARVFGIDMTISLDPSHSEEELRGAIDLHKGTDPEIRQERAMLRSILELGDVEVAAIMTHRSNMVTVDADAPPDRAIEQMHSSPFTRIPIWRGDPDNIIGVVHAKTLWREISSRGDSLEGLDLEAIATTPWFIPDTTTLLEQLQAFRRRREHFALVVDEYGSLMGLVTLEDILEEIVGDISDETDISVPGVRAQPGGSYIVDGSVTIRDLNREFEWNLPDDDASTIAGLVLQEARLIPDVGQVFNFHGFRFEVLRRRGNRIAALRITPPARTPGS